jgi:hypothetical protein
MSIMIMLEMWLDFFKLKTLDTMQILFYENGVVGSFPPLYFALKRL